MWGYTPDECSLYLEHMEREVMFRDGVLYFLGDRSLVQPGRAEKPVTTEDKYCQACRLKNKGQQDCSSCSRDIKVMEDGDSRD
jgi:hypothetical protein